MEQSPYPKYLLLNSYRNSVTIAELLVEASTDITEEILYEAVIDIINRRKIIKEMRKELLDLLMLYSKNESEHTYKDYYIKLAEHFTIIMLAVFEDLETVGYQRDKQYCFQEILSINTLVLRLNHEHPCSNR